MNKSFHNDTKEHLQENGRVAELEKEVLEYSRNLKNATEGAIKLATNVHELEKECERLKGLVEKAYKWGCSYAGQSNNQETYWQQFKTENNL